MGPFHIYRINEDAAITFLSAWFTLEDARRWWHEGDYYHPRVPSDPSTGATDRDGLFILDTRSIRCWEVDEDGLLLKSIY